MSNAELALHRTGARVIPYAVQHVVQRLRRAVRGDAGMSTAEYAIGTVAAAAFASLLYTVVTGDSVTKALTGLVQRALEASF